MEIKCQKASKRPLSLKKTKRVEEILALYIHERHIGYKSTAGATAKCKTVLVNEGWFRSEGCW